MTGLEPLFRAMYGAGGSPLEVRFWDGSSIRIPSDAPPAIHFEVRGPEQLRAALLPLNAPRLIEVFLQGALEVRGPLDQAFDLLFRLTTSPRFLLLYLRLLPAILAMPRGNGHKGAGRAMLRGGRHSLERDRAAVSFHYDLPVAFHRLFLGERLIYSCACFEDGEEEIDGAQERKLERIFTRLQLRPGDRLLDVGAGFGALALLAAQRHGVEAVGVTTSRTQAEYAAARARETGMSSRVRVECRDYRDLHDLRDGLFEKIASVEMSEHVGRANLGRYFEILWRSLKPGGLCLHQSNSLVPSVSRRLPFVPPYYGLDGMLNDYLLPDADLVPVGDVLKAAWRTGFRVVDVEDWSAHAAKTARSWLSRLEANEQAAIETAGPVAYQARRLLLAGVANMADRELLKVHQTVLSRPG